MEFPFFHGKITRRTCEELLTKKKKNGNYLIRESESVEGALCLCVLLSSVLLFCLCFIRFYCTTSHVFNTTYYLQICPALPFNNVEYYVYNVFRSFQDLIYTYRIFREHDGYFRIQTSEGVPERTFKTLKDLIYAFEKPNQGLITNLCYPVKRPKASKGNQRFNSEKDNIYGEIDDSGDYITVLP